VAGRSQASAVRRGSGIGLIFTFHIRIQRIVIGKWFLVIGSDYNSALILIHSRRLHRSLLWCPAAIVRKRRPRSAKATAEPDLQRALSYFTRGRFFRAPLIRPLGSAHLRRGYLARSVHRNRDRFEAVSVCRQTQHRRQLMAAGARGFVPGDGALLTLVNIDFGLTLAGKVDRVGQRLAIRRKLPPISLGRFAFQLVGELHGVSINRFA
jgi:hypothetical protein